MTRSGVAAAMIVVVSGTSVGAKEVPVDARASYVLFDVEKLDDSAMKGVSMPGSLTLAPYDKVAGDVAGGAAAERIVLLNKPLAKSKQSRQYLARVAPGTWVIEGASGTAFSLGSRTFAVAPGAVVDLGVVKPAIDWVEGEGPKSMVGGIMGAALFGSMRPKQVRPVRMSWRARGTFDLSAPKSLAGRSIDPVTFDNDATFGNHLGGLVNRFGGRRDRPAMDRPAAQPD